MKKLLALGLLVFAVGQVIGFSTPHEVARKARAKLREHACVPFCTAMGDSGDFGDSFQQCKLDCKRCVQDNSLLPGVVECLKAEATPAMRAERETDLRKEAGKNEMRIAKEYAAALNKQKIKRGLPKDSESKKPKKREKSAATR